MIKEKPLSEINFGDGVLRLLLAIYMLIRNFALGHILRECIGVRLKRVEKFSMKRPSKFLNTIKTEQICVFKLSFFISRCLRG